MLLKERASGMYRLSAFYIARTISDVRHRDQGINILHCFIVTIYVFFPLPFWAASVCSVEARSALACYRNHSVLNCLLKLGRNPTRVIVPALHPP